MAQRLQARQLLLYMSLHKLKRMGVSSELSTPLGITRQDARYAAPGTGNCIPSPIPSSPRPPRAAAQSCASATRAASAAPPRLRTNARRASRPPPCGSAELAQGLPWSDAAPPGPQPPHGSGRRGVAGGPRPWHQRRGARDRGGSARAPTPGSARTPAVAPPAHTPAAALQLRVPS